MFDGHDQMPRLGRFLFGGWLQSEDCFFDPDRSEAVASYRDQWGVFHKRKVRTAYNGWTVTDTITGFKQSAVLHWNLSDDEWYFEGEWLIGSLIKIKVKSDNKLIISLKNRWESLYYGEKHSMPVLEVICKQNGMIQTDIALV
jgi:hypothetical protein